MLFRSLKEELKFADNNRDALTKELDVIKAKLQANQKTRELQDQRDKLNSEKQEIKTGINQLDSGQRISLEDFFIKNCVRD